MVKIGRQEMARVLHYYNIEVRDSTYKIVCPFHGDVNASLQVNMDKGDWFCFGCNRGGDAFDFAFHAEAEKKLGDLQMWQRYFRILKSEKVSKIQLTTASVATEIDHKKIKRDLIIAKQYYYGLITVDWSADSLIDEEKKYLLQRGFTEKSLNDCKAKPTFNQHYPVVFPMMDNGKFKGWVCRTTDKRIEKKRKYLYNEGFRRRTTIAGDYNNKTVMLVEGYMDMLKAKQLGAKYVGAILGWKITFEQIHKLKEAGVATIISALDNDKCGKDGTLELRKHFKVIRFQYPSNIKDIGDMNQKSFDRANNKTKTIYRRKQNELSIKNEKRHK